jgi:hypothetical protein
MKKLSVSLKESRFVDLINKKFTGERRKEDGKKVKTCLGTEIFLKNPESDYNGLIKDMFRLYPSLGFTIGSVPYNVNFEDLKNFKIPYKYLVYEDKYRISLMSEFTPYSDCEDELKKWHEIDNEFDYDEICRGISEKIKEVGELIVLIKFDDDCVDDYEIDNYDWKYHLLLIDEDTVSNWYYKYIDESDETNYLEKFEDEIRDQYPELKHTDFIVWDYNVQYYNISLPLNINNLNNIKEYYEYAKKWFKV